jgi:hypothetical protein
MKISWKITGSANANLATKIDKCKQNFMQAFHLTMCQVFCMIKRFKGAAESGDTAQHDIFEFAPIFLHQIIAPSPAAASPNSCVLKT